MAKSLKLPNSLKLFFGISLLLDAVAGFTEAYLRYARHFPWPYNSPLLNDPHGGDLTVFPERFLHIHTDSFFSPAYGSQFVYPAPIALLYGFFYQFSDPYKALEGTVLLIAFAAALWFAACLHQVLGMSWLRCSAIAGGTLLLSYPLAFEYKQLNMEIFICVLCGFGVWFLVRDRLHISAIFFGIAIAAKLFPVVYLGFFVARRRFGPAFTALCITVVSTLISLRYISPSVLRAWRGINKGMAQLQEAVILSYTPEIGTDHSLFAFIKIAIRPLGLSQHQLATYFQMYLLAIAVFCLVLYFFRIRLLPLINQVLCLYVIAVVVTPSSYDYTLLHLYVPFVMLLFYAFRRRELTVPGLTAVFVVMAGIFSVETEIILRRGHGIPHTAEGQLKCLLLLLLLFLALRFPFPNEPLSGSLEAPPGVPLRSGAAAS